MLSSRVSGMNRIIFPVVAFLLGMATHALFSSWKPNSALSETDLKIYLSKGPFRIFVEDSEGDIFDEYAIFHGNDCLIERHFSKNKGVHETTYFRKGQSVLVYSEDVAGHVADRSFFVRSHGELRYGYCDDNGDGLWDIFLDYSARKKFFWRDKWTE